MGVTKQRQIIASILTAREHLTADQVLERARQALPNVGMGTVYRNLNRMADEGVIRRLAVPGQPVRFDGNAVPHQHTVCVACGGIGDIGGLEPSELNKLVAPRAEIVDHALLVYVVCEKCAEKV